MSDAQKYPAKKCRYCDHVGTAYTFTNGLTICRTCFVGLPIELKDCYDEIVKLRKEVVTLQAAQSVQAAELERLQQCESALKGMLGIVSDSTGVSGYHLNGEIAEWDSFEEVGEAYAAIAEEKNHG